MKIRWRIYRWFEMRCGTAGPRMFTFYNQFLDIFDELGWEPPENDVLRQWIDAHCDDDGKLQ